MNFIRGLDPLGLQNTSDSTFSILLPGLNNVTGEYDTIVSIVGF